MPADQTVRVSLPRHVYVVAVVFGLLMLATLAFQLVMINDQRTTNDRQLEITARQSARAIPLLDRTRPLVDQLNAALPETKDLARDAEELADTATPLLKDLRDTRAGENLRAAGKLAAVLLDADVGSATRATRMVAAELLRAGLPRTADLIDATAGELLHKDRLRRLLVRQLHLAPTLQRVVPEQLRMLQRSVAVQEETLRTQVEALAAIRETLAVARETERHAESLDNKTGGSGTTGAPPPTEGPTR